MEEKRIPLQNKIDENTILTARTINAGLTYTTTEPTADNTSGGIKIVVLNKVPNTWYQGWLYLISG